MKKYLFSIIAVMLTAGLTLIYADQKVYEKKCSKCHSLRNPDNYSRADWKRNVERMAARADLSESDIKSIIELNQKK